MTTVDKLQVVTKLGNVLSRTMVIDDLLNYEP